MIEKYKRGGVGYILAKFEKTHETGTGIMGLDGKELVIGDTDYQKERRARIFGTVIQIPVALGKKPLYSEKSGVPGYGAIRLPEADIEVIHDAVYARPQNKVKWFHDMLPEVQIGDRVYCAWTQIFDQRNMIAKAPDGKSFIFKISYDCIYCVVREGKIIPIGSHILVDPVFDAWESQLKPTYYPFNGPDGKPAVRPKKEWMQVKVHERHRDREGIIAHIGSPLKGERCALKKGMKILYRPKLQNLLDIEGGKYFILRQNQVMLYRSQS